MSLKVLGVGSTFALPGQTAKKKVSLWRGCPVWNYEAWEDPSTSLSPR